VTEKLTKLLDMQESETLDFKELLFLNSDSEKAEFAKDISAFANTKGGHIIYGVKDKTWEKLVSIQKKLMKTKCIK